MKNYPGKLNFRGLWRHLFATLTLVLVTVGCQRSGEILVPVKGKVTYKGQPLVGGIVMFQPMENGNISTRRPSTGVIGADGVYQMSTFKLADGVKPGEYRVAVDGGLTGEAQPTTLEAAPPSGSQATRHPDKYRLPESSGLKATVPENTNQVEIDFNLDA